MQKQQIAAPSSPKLGGQISRPFDPYWITEDTELSCYLFDLCSKLTGAETRKRKRSKDAQGNFEDAIKAIVLDLYRASMSDPELHVGIASGNTVLHKRSKSIYGSKLLSPRTFSAALAILQVKGYVVQTRPHWDDPAGKNSRTARYQAAPNLLEEIKKTGVSIVSLRRSKGFECVRLKDADKRLVEYSVVPFADMARTRLQTINEMLTSHWIDLALTDEQLTAETVKGRGAKRNEAAHPFDFSARTVYRVFNNSDWEQGGRFYGAWWIGCPSSLRRHILIDGKRTVEVDYSGLHAAMLFVTADLPIPDDPYERCMERLNVSSSMVRKLVKQTFNALLNADHVSDLQEVEGYSDGKLNIAWQDFKKLIVGCYPEFKSYFGTGIGVRLQRHDSDLAEAVMLKFAKEGYACLPVHDSFIVHHEMQNELKKAMHLEFAKTFGRAGAMKSVEGFGEPVKASEKLLQPDVDCLLQLTGNQKRLHEFWSLSGRPF